MGSFNITCSATGVPITPGDPVYGYFIKKKDHDNSICYSTDLYSPINLGLKGVYNDYGYVKFDDESETHKSFILNYLKGEIVDKDVGENKFHEHAIVSSELTLESLVELSYETRLELRREAFMARISGKQNPYILAFVAIHRDYVDKFCKKDIQTYGYPKGKFYDEVLKQALDVPKSFDEIKDKDESIALGRHFVINRLLEDRDKALAFLGALRGNDSGTLLHYKLHITDLLEKGNIKEFNYYAEACAAHFFLELSFSKLRKNWGVIQSAGQDTNYDDYILQNKFITKFCRNKIKEYDR